MLDLEPVCLSYRLYFLCFSYNKSDNSNFNYMIFQISEEAHGFT